MSDVVSVWPDGCRKPNTCERHRQCAYGPCRWQNVDISGAIDNAVALVVAARNAPAAPARPDDASERARLEGEVARLREALAAAVRVAGEARDEWDKAPNGMKAGKLLIALSDPRLKYRDDITAIHEALRHDR